MTKITIIIYIILVSLAPLGAKGIKININTADKPCGAKNPTNTSFSIYYKYVEKSDSFVYYYDSTGKLHKSGGRFQKFDLKGRIISIKNYSYTSTDSNIIDSISYYYSKKERIFTQYRFGGAKLLITGDTVYLDKNGNDSLCFYFDNSGISYGVDSMIRHGYKNYYTGKNLDSTFLIWIYKNQTKIHNDTTLWRKTLNYPDSQIFLYYTGGYLAAYNKHRIVSNLLFIDSSIQYKYKSKDIKSRTIDSIVLNKDTLIFSMNSTRYDESSGKFLPFDAYKYYYNSNGSRKRVVHFNYSGFSNSSFVCPSLEVQTFTYDSVNYITSMVASPMGENKLTIYPNPVGTDRIIYLGNSINSGIVQVYGLDGKLIYSTGIKSSNKVEMPIEIPKGMYLMRVQDSAGWSGYSKVMVE